MKIKTKIQTMVILLAVVSMFAFGTTAHAETLCNGNHNYYWYVYYAGEYELESFEPIPDGYLRPWYAWGYFSREKHGVCVCGDCTYFGREVVMCKKIKNPDRIY